MKDLFYTGGPLFMSILSAIFVNMIVWFIYHFVQLYGSKQLGKEKALRNMNYGRSIGLFALVTGILGQLIGFYDAFSAIEHTGDISPALVFGGIKVSLITTLYGIFIFLLSIILWFIGSYLIEQKKA